MCLKIQWTEISSILIMILLLSWGISLMRENSRLKKKKRVIKFNWASIDIWLTKTDVGAI